MVRATFGAEHASQPGPNGQAMEVVAYGLPRPVGSSSLVSFSLRHVPSYARTKR